ncbi:MAG: hypothetical protein JW732_05170 [Dehalococcoidia bacterium]|nr:hypothetical protein [Dehalococcoidia bacterium]
MELLIAFGTDDGKYLANGYAGDAKYFYLYKFSDNKEESVEQRRNIELKEDQSLKVGSPEMAKARAEWTVDRTFSMEFSLSSVEH